MSHNSYEEDLRLLQMNENDGYEKAPSSNYLRKAPMITEEAPQGSRPARPHLITEEEDSKAPALSSGVKGGALIGEAGVAANPTGSALARREFDGRMAKKNPTSVRKDGFFSYFNPLNWFKWSKEKKLARQAAKAIADPSSAPGFSMTPAHTAALNTTHGQKILKSAAKDNIKAERDPMSELNYRREEEGHRVNHVRMNMPKRTQLHNRNSEELEKIPRSKWTAADRLGYSLDSGPQPDTAKIASTYKPTSYEAWKTSEDREGEQRLAAKEAGNRKLAGSAWGKSHVRELREANPNVTPERIEAARQNHQANRAVRPLLQNNLDLPPIMLDMWGKSSNSAAKSQRWVQQMQSQAPALRNGANLPWGGAFGNTGDGFDFEEDYDDQKSFAGTNANGHNSVEHVQSSTGKKGNEVESIDLDDDAEQERQNHLKFQQAAAEYAKRNVPAKAQAQKSFEIMDPDSDEEDEFGDDGKSEGKQFIYNFIQQQANDMAMKYATKNQQSRPESEDYD